MNVRCAKNTTDFMEVYDSEWEKHFIKLKQNFHTKFIYIKPKKEESQNRTGKKKIMTTETRVKENILKNCMINNNKKTKNCKTWKCVTHVMWQNMRHTKLIFCIFFGSHQVKLWTFYDENNNNKGKKKHYHHRHHIVNNNESKRPEKNFFVYIMRKKFW